MIFETFIRIQEYVPNDADSTEFKLQIAYTIFVKNVLWICYVIR